MRVSAKAEYACVAMIELAAGFADPQPTRVKAIAEAHGISQQFLVQILLQLKTAGLVVSVRGAAGGYQLARSPTEISLADVIHAIDREAMPRSQPGTVASPALAALHSVWKEIQLEEQRRLEEVTLADLVRRSQESTALTYQI